MSTTYKKYRTANDEPIQVDSAIRDGAGKNIENNYAKQSGFYGTLGAGRATLAQGLEPVTDESGSEQSAPFLFQATATNDNTTSTAVGDIAQLRELQGNSLVWNQLVQNGNFANGTSNWYTGNAAISVSNNVATIRASARWGNCTSAINIVSGHKYFATIDIKLSTSGPSTNVRFGIGTTGFFGSEGACVSIGDSPANTWKTHEFIRTFTKIDADTEVNNYFIIMDFREGDFDDMQVRNCMLIDLTKIYGAGNEPTTVEEFKERFPKDYYAYNVGSILDASSSKLISRGKNQFDLSVATEGKYVNHGDGTLASSSSFVASDFIRVIPGQRYYFSLGDSTDYSEWGAGYVEANQNSFVQAVDLHPNVENSSYNVIPEGVNYIRISIPAAYKDVASINIDWEDGESHTYSPYEVHEYNLPVLDEPLRSLITSGDAEVIVRDSLSSDGVLTRRIGSIDLKDIVWSKDSDYWYAYSLPAVKKDGIVYAMTNKLNYAVKGNDSANTNCFTTSGGGLFEVYGPDKTASEIQTMFSGVILYYALAEESVTETENTFTENIEINDYGTMEFVPAGSPDVLVKQGNKFFYPANYVGMIDDLYTRVDGDVEQLVKQDVIDAIDEGTHVVGKSIVSESIETEVGNDDQTPFAYMTAGGQSDITTGIQRLDKLVGVDVVNNQWVSPINHTNRGLTSTYDSSTRRWHITGTTTGYAAPRLTPTGDDGNVFKGISNHKYLVLLNTEYASETSQGAGFFILGINTIVGYKRSSFVFTNTETRTLECQMVWSTSDLVVDTYVKLKIVDLTQRYGSNEVVNVIIGTGTDEEQVVRLLQFDPSLLEESEYNTGSFPEIKSAQLKSVGYNLFSADNFGKNYFINGQTGIKGAGSYCGTDSKIRVMGNSQIGIIFPSTSNGGVFLYEYDINGNFITAKSTSTTTQVAIFTLSPNCAYIEFCKNQTYYGTEYKNDISCFLYWDGSRIGYEPYKSETYQLPNIQLHGVLKVVDGNVVADGDELYPNGEGNKKRYGVVDLGTTNGAVVDNSGVFSFGFPSNAKAVPYSTKIISNTKYQLNNYTANPTNQDNNTYLVPSGGAYAQFKNTAFANKTFAEFQATMVGKYLIYELAEPTDLEASTFTPNIWADDFGTLQFLDEDGNEIKGLQGCEIFYKANIAGFAESVGIKADWDPDNVVVQEELVPYTEKDTQLLNAVGGTLRQLLAISQSIDFLNTNVVDLGTFNWYYDTTYNIFMINDNAISDDAHDNKMLCTKYKVVSNRDWTLLANGQMVQYTNGNIYIRDTAYTDATAFKAAVKGVLLAYEKASS